MVLGIESSCDETAVAVVRSGTQILANCVYSQIEAHAPFHGVVPEIASRAHLEKINGLYEQALDEAGVSIQDCACIAVSNRPGLTGSLMIGANLAKSIALVHDLPVLPVNHLEAHLYASALEGARIEVPFLGLLLSGGNSAIFEVRGPGQLLRIADTMDDALGEAFDKASSLIGLGYPGGPRIEAAARAYADQHGLAHQYSGEGSLFPRLLKNLPRSDLAFSFSGIKTAVRKAVQDLPVAPGAAAQPEHIGRICFDFQNTVFELVARVTERAVARTGIRRVIASGGVLANGILRQVLQSSADRKRFQLTFPRSRALCTDNAAMVAALGWHLLQTGPVATTLDFDVSSRAL
ncbi:MAG: tRNA (adenosine(37)-N6)-threonylcarbamoyltransferase complex transferase subunit TsaD [Leptospiraceae bacterium]|nr:tRNA (adenosine(37)-N6)-threonylcarbamoyltransferase complex transferase subunit TsaD [Leptospiraceae bacterium]